MGERGWAAVLVGVSLAAAVAVGEVAARVAVAVRAHVQGGRLDLDEYERPDPAHRGNWVLRPGYEVTLGELIGQKRRDGREMAVRILSRREDAGGPILRVNSDGYKGPELEAGKRRVLAVGDSCTFGTWFDSNSYPRVLGRRLGAGWEAINGGVEGYGADNVLLRMKEFVALRPEVVVLYIGWNDIYGDEEALRGWWFRSRLLRLLTRGLRPAVADAAGYEPSSRGKVERIVAGFGGVGVRVIVLSLPGLFVAGEEASEAARAIGHLPAFVREPAVLAQMTAGYNAMLAQVAREAGAEFVDLEAWSRGAFVGGRERWFTDSVHLTERGQEMVGEFLAGVVAAGS